jgi:lysozyme family protein
VADFNQALQKTLIHEAGYQNRPKDKGNWYNGINYGTRYGITAADVAHYFPTLISDLNCVRNLTTEQATIVYKGGYWKDLYSQINAQLVAEKLFDMGVLMGVGTAVKLLQITLKNVIAIVPDGVFGPQTLADVNQQDGAHLLANYRTTLIQHAINIVNNNPNDAEDIQGWITRINS